MTADGRELWSYAFHTQELVQVAADNGGGVVVVVKAGHECRSAYDCTPLPAAVRRLDGPTGQITWEHLAEVEYGVVSEVAIGADGRVLFVETNGSARQATLVGIDGDTGVRTRGRWRAATTRRTPTASCRRTARRRRSVRDPSWMTMAR